MNPSFGRQTPTPGLLGWLNRLLVVLIVTAIFAGMTLRYLPLIRLDQTLREDLQRKEDEVRKLRAETTRLEAEIRALRSDPKTIERRLRELGYARTDEVVVTFKEPAK
jgi:cell division protein FtsB